MLDRWLPAFTQGGSTGEDGKAGKFAIRAIEPEDVPALTDLLDQPRVIRGTMQRPFTSVAARQKRSADFHPDLRLVAGTAGRVVGTLSPDREAHRRAHAAGIGMAVHDDFQGQGCGAALLAAAVDHADRWLTVTRLDLSVWADNDPAIRLYERHGFQCEGLGRAYALRDGVFADARHGAAQDLRMARGPCQH